VETTSNRERCSAISIWRSGFRPTIRCGGFGLYLDGTLKDLSTHFEALYARRGRPSIPPEKLLRALLLQILYAIRSERQLMEQMNYNLLFRWFVGLNPDDAVWDTTVFTKTREWLMHKARSRSACWRRCWSRRVPAIC